MSVLITSINDKRPMVQAITKAAHAIGEKSIGSDINIHAPAIQDVDSFLNLPPSHDKSFKEAVLSTVKSHAIKLILPSRDGDIMPLAKFSTELNQLGCTLPLPSMQTISQCQDKLAFAYKLKEFGFKYIPILENLSDNIETYFTRPKFGSSSVGAKILTNLNDAQIIIDDPESLLHPYIDAPEYSIDLLMDLDKKPLNAVVRQRQKILGGEAKLTQVENQEYLKNQTMKLGELLGLKGHNLIQAFLPEDGEPIFIEVNLRFGGASILALKAGLNTPEILLRQSHGLSINSSSYNNIQYGLSLRRERHEDVEVDRFYVA